MRRLLTVLFVLLPYSLLAQRYSPRGELESLCRVHDGTDVWLIDASGNGMVGDGAGPLTVDGTLTCNAGTGTFVVGDGAGALNVIVDSGSVTVSATDLDIRNLTAATDTVVCNAGTGTFTVGDGAGALNVIVDSGTVTANAGTGNFNVVGTKSDNGGAPGATNLGVLPAVALAADPTRTEGNQVALRTQLDGDLVTAMVDELPAGTQNIGDVDIVTLPNEGQQTAPNSISVTPDTDNDAIGATGSAPPGEVVDIGGRASGADTTGLMTGITVCTDHAAVDIVTATTTLIVTGVANRHVRICAINLISAGANNVAIVAGTGATCATSTAGVNGGVTAAEGWNLAANGGIAQGSGIGEIMSTKVTGGATGDSVCIITSAAVQLSGTIAYAIF